MIIEYFHFYREIPLYKGRDPKNARGLRNVEKFAAVLTGRPLIKIIILKVKHFMLKQNPVLPYSVSESEEDI